MGVKSRKQFSSLGSHSCIVVFQVTRQHFTPDPLEYVDANTVWKGQRLPNDGDDILVSEYGSGSVLRLDPDAPDQRTAIASGIAEPAGLAVHGGDVYLADRSGTVLQILDDGETLAPPRPVASGLSGPEGIAAADDCSLYVVEVEGGRVIRVDAESGAATAVADGLALSGPERRALAGTTSVGELAGIAVGDGALFVSTYRDNRVYRIAP